METETQLAFEGTKEEQELATRAFDVMKRKGMLFGANAPIRMSAEAIAKALTKEGGAMSGGDVGKLAPQISKTLEKNPDVFAREDNGDFATTKAGRAYHAGQGQGPNTHTFKQRLNTQVTALDAGASREYAESLVNRAAEREAFIDTLADLPAPPAPRNTPHLPPQPVRPIEFQTLIPQHLIPQPPPVEQPQEEPEVIEPAPHRAPEPAVHAPTTPTTIAPATPAPAAASAASATPASAPAVPTQPVVATPLTATPPAAAEAIPAPAPAVPTQPATETSASAPGPIAPAPVAATTPPTAQTQEAQATQAAVSAPKPAPAATQPVTQAPAPAPHPAPARPVAPAPAPAPVAPVITGPIEVQVPTADGPVTVDLTQPVDDILEDESVAAGLEAMVAAMLENDSRLVRFGSDLFTEEASERFSKGDFRRIREYLEEPETGGVASDRDIMADVLGRRPEHPDYERARFSLNYRLLKEKKDFEFVGIDTDRLWIIANASPVAPPPRKPAEIGADYRYLEDPAVQSAEQGGQADGPRPLDYSLTYYEYENGVLPYDAYFKQIYPGAVFEDQRTSLIRFEIPQLYGALIAELRYPTGNRGGYIMGLNELFNDHLVPGAKFQIIPTDRGEDVFEIRYNTVKEREESLLQLDDRRGRYVFRPVSYTVETDPNMLLTESKFSKLHNQKKLDESERKKIDNIIAQAFDAVGESVDGKTWAMIDDLYPVVNIDRPVSQSLLKTLLSGAYPYFYPDETTEGFYFYDPAKRNT